MKKQQYELKTLPHVAMAGPIEFSMTIHAVTPDKKAARMTVYLEAGIIPTPAHVKNILANCIHDATGSIPNGTRLMTKPEFLAYFTKRETGTEVPMEGPQVFEPPEDTITKAMLVDAICGKGFRNDQEAAQWVKDGFATAEIASVGHGEGRPFFRWNRDKLNHLDETTLLKIYNYG
jgi:hypothetical protein